ncbi:phosphotransferase family protein [Pseudonocardia sp. CA-142604]|uniref:phosphotransferase family protein n=1 Tax=Pseudonocardia sp. CA-142604 TaxID=3240024 RepID=UPI003D8C0BF4
MVAWPVTATVQETLGAAGVWRGAELMLDAAVTIASPSWWGADSRRWSVRSPVPDRLAGTAAFVKLMEPHAHAYVDLATAFALAREAGEAGIGPRVHLADVDRGLLVMEDLTELAATATLDRFDDLDRVEQLVALRREVHGLPGCTRRATVFDDIRDAHRLVVDAGGALPEDFPWMVRMLGTAEERIAASGYDLVPCHGDGNVSNVLIAHGDGSLRLVDWDCAALMDPLQDLGVLLQELGTSDVDARAVFEMYWGTSDDALFDRCRVYGIADAVRWGLVGAYADAARPGTHEYAKFSGWQFLRARAGLRDPHLDDRLRSL